MLEDYSGKTELVLFGDDYVRYAPYLQHGQAIYLTGAFKQRFNNSEFEYKVSNISLAENIKRQLTKQLQLEIDVRNVEKPIVDFLEQNMKAFPGKSGLKIIISEPKNNLKANFISLDKGLEINNELISFLAQKPEIDVKITAV